MSLSDLTSSPMNVAARRPKRLHRNNGQPKPQSVAAARERALDGALKPDNKFLSSPVWQGEPRVSLLQLNDLTCKWPIGDPLKPGFGFCGEQTKEKPRGKDGSYRGTFPYCPHHQQIATAPKEARDGD